MDEFESPEQGSETFESEDDADRFAPPQSKELPRELLGAAPRQIPFEFQQGRLAQYRVKMLTVSLFFGLNGILLSFLPFIQTLAIYILPLGYLLWIGLGICAIGVIAFLQATEISKAKSYIADGEVGWAKVIGLVKTPMQIVNGQTTSMAIVAGLRVRHPQTNEIVTIEVQSRGFTPDNSSEIDTRFRVGDWVSVVWMPNKFETSVQIYDFLEAMPGADLDRKKGELSLVEVVAVVAVIGLIILVLFWNIFAFGKYQPIEVAFQDGVWPFAIGAVLGLAAVIGGYLFSKRKTQRKLEQNELALNEGRAIELDGKPKGLLGRFFWGSLITLGVAGIGGASLLCWAFTLNAWLDTSPEKSEPVTITEMTQTTHSFIFREYELSYRLPEREEDSAMMTTPQHLSQFTVPLGVAKLREGFFGWPWVANVEPVHEFNGEMQPD